MRKVVTLSLITVIGLNSYGQSWMDIGIKGGWGLNFLYNKNMLDNDYTAKFSNGFTVGGKLGWNFNESHEMTLDVMYYQFNQTFKYNRTDSSGTASPEYTRNISFSGMQLFLLYRNNKDGHYVEVGPSLTTVGNAKVTDDLGVTPAQDNYAGFMQSHVGFTFGFGGYFIGTENFGITMGFRANYAITDAVKDDGVTNFPAFEKFDSYTATHPLTLMLVMEANLDFAFMAKAKCSNKRKLILF
ncbi:MAG TPA: outer membrane beta-barrel protein [Flavobacteriales bacterium]|nr:outer membrane beta-barrel protein [Flavobacteriales bacterium]